MSSIEHSLDMAANIKGAFAVALVDYETSNWWLVANMYVRGIFFAFVIIPIQAATFATIRLVPMPTEAAIPSSLRMRARMVAAACGGVPAIASQPVTSRYASSRPPDSTRGV